MNAELGQLILQSAINHIHNEELTKTIEEFRNWQFLNATFFSTVERIALYHMDLWQGKIFRYQNQFSNSLACLQKALLKTEYENSFENARPRLICDLKNIYCELKDLLHTEHFLETEIKRLNDRGKKNFTDRCLLQIFHVESLWGQKRFEKIEAFCSGIQPFFHLSKFDKLRFSILFGRIYHTRCDWSNARYYWTKTLSEFSAYLLINGHISRMIFYFMKKVLLQKGNFEWSTKYKDQIKKMKEIKPGKCEYWIPGLGK